MGCQANMKFRFAAVTLALKDGFGDLFLSACRGKAKWGGSIYRNAADGFGEVIEQSAKSLAHGGNENSSPCALLNALRSEKSTREGGNGKYHFSSMAFPTNMPSSVLSE